jgi:hypothetical protein
MTHFLDSRFTDGGKVVSLTRRPPFISRKIPRYVPKSSLNNRQLDINLSDLECKKYVDVSK